MNRQDIVNELRDRGYVAEIKDTYKNGVTIKGIVIIGEINPTPIIYTETPPCGNVSCPCHKS